MMKERRVVRKSFCYFVVGQKVARLFGASGSSAHRAGLGAAIIDPLRHAGYTVDAFWGSGRPPVEDEDAARWANRRSWSYGRLRKMFLDGRIAIPNDRLLVEEIAAIRFTVDGRDGFLVGKKKELRTALGRSPDRADALMMAVAAGFDAVTIGGTVDLSF